MLKQRTIKRAIWCQGIGLHAGKSVTMELKPALANTGIRFITPEGEFFVAPNFAIPSQLCTILSPVNGGDARLQTIEHLLSALVAYNIYNIEVHLNANEVPILDGSAKGFISLIELAGIRDLYLPQLRLHVCDVVEVREGDKFVRLKPSQGHNQGLSVDCTIDFDHADMSEVVGRQQMSLDINTKSFKQEIANARTFTSASLVKGLRANGYALGGSLDNAVLFADNEVVNPQGLRYDDECVRHKILDAIGDLALLGMPVVGQYQSYKPSHALHTKLVQKLVSCADHYSIDGDEELRNAFFAITKHCHVLTTYNKTHGID